MADEPQDKQNQEETAKSSESDSSVILGTLHHTVRGTPESKDAGQASPVPYGTGASMTEVETEAEEAPATKEKAEKPKPAPKPVSVNLEKIIEQIEKLSVLELSDLVHALEDRFGVSAQTPVMAVGASGAPTGATEPVEEKTTFNVILTAAGANKIAVIKAVRELVPTLGLKEAKDLVEAAPKPVLESVNKQNAEEAKTKLTAAGGTVELQ